MKYVVPDATAIIHLIEIGGRAALDALAEKGDRIFVGQDTIDEITAPQASVQSWKIDIFLDWRNDLIARDVVEYAPIASIEDYERYNPTGKAGQAASRLA